MQLGAAPKVARSQCPKYLFNSSSWSPRSPALPRLATLADKPMRDVALCFVLHTSASAVVTASVNTCKFDASNVLARIGATFVDDSTLLGLS